jgi:hypothetical protein
MQIIKNKQELNKEIKKLKAIWKESRLCSYDGIFT